MDAGLYIVGTPIGNLRDITLRALDILREADLVLAEDTRQTRKLCARHEIDTRLVSCHKFNEAARSEWVIERVQGIDGFYGASSTERFPTEVAIKKQIEDFKSIRLPRI